MINKIAKFIPRRRRRKLHIGLFGYSRDFKRIKLPRAITFTAALYSVGLPPEILGLNILSKEDFEFVKEVYINFEADLIDTLRFFNPDTIFLPDELKQVIKQIDFYIDEAHKEITDYIIKVVKEDKDEDLREYVVKAAYLRKFLG